MTDDTPLHHALRLTKEAIARMGECQSDKSYLPCSQDFEALQQLRAELRYGAARTYLIARDLRALLEGRPEGGGLSLEIVTR